MTETTKKPRKSNRLDPLSVVAQTLIGVLEQRRQTSSIGLCLTELLEHVPGLTADDAQQALQKPIAKKRIIAVFSGEIESPLLLKEDLEAASQSTELLKLLVGRRCSAAVPMSLLSELTQSLVPALKKLVDQYWPQHIDRLPAGLSPMLTGSGKKQRLALHDAQFPLPEVELSHKLVAALQAKAIKEKPPTPTSWPELLDLINANDSADLIQQATRQQPFAGSVREFVTQSQTWIALKQDFPEVVCSESFLQSLIQATCHAEAPEVKLSVLARQLPKDLQPPFLARWLAEFDHRREYDFVQLASTGTAKKRDLRLQDRRFPPAEIRWGENAVKILHSLKAIGGTSYPATWTRLVELAGTPLTPSIREKVVKTEPFQSQVIVSFLGDPNAPLALSGDDELLANSPALWRIVLEKLRTNENQLLTVDKLVNQKGLYPSLRPRLQAAIERMIRDKSLPPGFGALKVAKKWGLFLSIDVIGTSVPSSPDFISRSDSASSNPAPPIENSASVDIRLFERDFDTAFSLLDGKLGLRHYASLVDLRPALKQYPRAVFDQEILKLRQSGRYSLSLMEGRFGLTDEERAAALVVDHIPHLLVQKKSH